MVPVHVRRPVVPAPDHPGLAPEGMTKDGWRTPRKTEVVLGPGSMRCRGICIIQPHEVVTLTPPAVTSAVHVEHTPDKATGAKGINEGQDGSGRWIEFLKPLAIGMEPQRIG